MKLSKIMQSSYPLISACIILGCLVSCSTSTESDPADLANSDTSIAIRTERYDSWPGFTLKEAVETADHIVYGKVTEIKEKVKRRDLSSEMIIENDLKIEVLDLLKDSKDAPKADKILPYHEMPQLSETSSDIPRNLKLGEEVILFLNPHSRILGPDYVISVENNDVALSPYLAESADLAQSLPLDRFKAFIKNHE